MVYPFYHAGRVSGGIAAGVAGLVAVVCECHERDRCRRASELAVAIHAGKELAHLLCYESCPYLCLDRFI